MYRSILRSWMKTLWSFTIAYNEPWNHSVTLPSYVCITFTNPEMTRRIHEQRDLAVRVIGRCVEALIVKKLTANMAPRNVPVSSHNNKACLTTILGTTNNDVEFLLDHPGATEFTEMVFLALDNLHPFSLETVPLYVLGVVQETFSILSRTLPKGWNASMLLDQTANTSDGQYEPAP